MITSSRFNALVVGMVPAYLFAKADLGGSMTEASIDLQRPPSDVESDCIGEVQAPSNVEEDHMQPTAAQIWSEVSFDSLVRM